MYKIEIDDNLRNNLSNLSRLIPINNTNKVRALDCIKLTNTI